MINEADTTKQGDGLVQNVSLAVPPSMDTWGSNGGLASDNNV